MAVFRTPVIYDQVTRQIRPAGVCDIIDPRYSSYDAGRLLYQDQTNALRLIDGQLYCSAVSKDKGNYIKAGKDGSPFLDGNAILSNGGDGLPNLLSIDAVDGKIVLTLDVLTNYGVATKTAIDIAVTNIKEYIDSAFVTLESFPSKVAAFTSEMATTQELDSLRVRVAALERAVQSLTSNITTAKDEAISEINTLKADVTGELYDIYDTFPSYTLLTSHNALRTQNTVEHEAVGVAGQIAAMSATTASKARNLTNEYSNDMLNSLSELNALSADVVANTQNAITHLEG